MFDLIDVYRWLGTDERYWFALVTSSLAAVCAFIAGFIWLRRAWAIDGTPTSTIRSAAQVYIEIQGEAKLMDGVQIVAPLSLLPCTWYRYSIDENRGDDDNQRLGIHWRTIESGVSDGLFLLRDDTGDCIIDPEGAAVTPSKVQVWYGESRMPPPGPGIPGHPAWGSTYRFREERIHDGDFLYAIGNLNTLRATADKPNPVEEVRDLLSAWKRDQRALLARFDANHDGVIYQEEWEQVRRAAAHAVVAEGGRRLSEPGIPVLGLPTNNRQPFLLSNLAPWRLSRRYRWWAGMALTLFLLGGAFAVGLLRMRYA